MSEGGRPLRSAQREGSETASKVLSHPTRVRILEVINEQDMSPIQFLNSGLCPDSLGDQDFQALLTHVSYHFRELKKFGCAVVVRTIERRGATEHIYRGAARAFFTNADWEKFDYDLRQRLSRTMLQGLIARAESAMISGTFDSRINRHLSWIPMKRLDEIGWSELATTVEGAFDDVEEIRRGAEERLEESGEEGISATVGLLLFESPPAQPGASLSYDDEGQSIEEVSGGVNPSPVDAASLVADEVSH